MSHSITYAHAVAYQIAKATEATSVGYGLIQPLLDWCWRIASLLVASHVHAPTLTPGVSSLENTRISKVLQLLWAR